MKKLAALTLTFVVFGCPALFAQDAMQYGLKHLKVLAEDQDVRVVRFSPRKGDKTPIHPCNGGVHSQRGQGQIHAA